MKGVNEILKSCQKRAGPIKLAFQRKAKDFSMADDDIAELTAQLSVLQAKLGVHSAGLKLWSV
jgi:hypothetical protein